MSRASRTKDLEEELRRLFGQDMSEVEAYEQVKDDDRFDNVRLSKVSTLYQQFRSQKVKKPKRKKPTAKIIERSNQLAHFQSAQEECNHNKMDCIKFWSGWTLDGRFFIVRDRIATNESATNSTLKDVFNNKACRIKIPIIPAIQAARNYHFWPLTHNFGLLTEYTDYVDENIFSRVSLSLLECDWFDKEIRKVHTFSFEEEQRHFIFQSITVDDMDPTRFILQNYHGDHSVTLKLGCVQDSELVFEDDILPENLNTAFGLGSLVGNTLYSFNLWNLINLEDSRMYVTQLDQDAETSEIELSPVPDQFTVVDGERLSVGWIAMGRLYLAVQHNETRRYGIIWTSHETGNWKAINFDIEQPITSIEYVIDDDILLVQAGDYETELISDVHQSQSTFYRIPCKKPEKLSVLAWSNLVRSKRKLEVIDPYEEARNYLPYNSNIRCPFED